MIKKLKIGLLILALVFLGATYVNAAAGDLVWSSAQTIDLSSPDLNLTIASGSTASSLVVNTGTIVPTLALGDVFTVSTAVAGDFAVSPSTGVSINCDSNTISTVVITAAGTQAYTITPSATPCTFQAGGGGGGGGGGSSYVPPVTTPATPAMPGEIPGCGNRTTGFSTSSAVSCVGNTSTIPATPASNPGYNMNTRASFDFGTKTLKNGSKGEAVKELQRFLNQVLNLGLVVDGKLGPKTIVVIKKWQKDHALVADGLIGPKTKKMMNDSVQ